MGIAIMIGNYFHDLSVALLASNVLVVYFLGRYLDTHPDKAAMTASVFRRLTVVTYAALAYVIIGGAFRAYFFMDYEWNPAAGNGQIAALVVKHILLVTVTVFGLIAHVRYQRRYGSQA